MFNLIICSDGNTHCYAFSDIECCIDFMNTSKALKYFTSDYINFTFSRCRINDITIPSQFILYYNIYDNKIYINCIDNELIGLKLTDDLTTEILYDLFKKNSFNIDDDAMW